MADMMTLTEVRDLLGMALAHGGPHISIHRIPARNAYDAIDAAIKQRERDKKDAARYRWLRKQHNSSIPSWHVRSSTNSIPLDLDIGLDAEMEEESGNG